MKKAANKVIGAQLKQLREEQRLTQEEVAGRLNVTQSLISRVEAGRRSMRLLDVFLYSDAMDITPERLYLGIRTALLEHEETESLVRQKDQAK